MVRLNATKRPGKLIRAVRVRSFATRASSHSEIATSRVEPAEITRPISEDVRKFQIQIKIQTTQLAVDVPIFRLSSAQAPVSSRLHLAQDAKGRHVRFTRSRALRRGEKLEFRVATTELGVAI